MPLATTTILRQIGSESLLALGARQIVNVKESTVEFYTHAPRRLVRVALAADDTYTINVYRINKRFDSVTVGTASDVYAGQLAGTIERIVAGSVR